MTSLLWPHSGMLPCGGDWTTTEYRIFTYLCIPNTRICQDPRTMRFCCLILGRRAIVGSESVRNSGNSVTSLYCQHVAAFYNIVITDDCNCHPWVLLPISVDTGLLVPISFPCPTWYREPGLSGPLTPCSAQYLYSVEDPSISFLRHSFILGL